MKPFSSARLRRFLTNEDGQSMVLMALTLTAVMGLAGLGTDAGHGYFAYQKLVASTNAATLAGAAGLPNTVTATANAKLYSSVAGQLNASGLLSNVTETANFECLNTVTTTLNTPCLTSTGASGGYNAIQVTQTAKVNTWFGGLFQMPWFNMSYTATAAMRGGTEAPWNIAIILDTTNSMSGRDSGTQCNGTQISCALLGVQALLNDLYPCTIGTPCSSGSTAFDSVALYVFPPVLASTAGNDYGNGSCPTSAPTHEWYTVPTLPSTWTYQIVNFANDYRTSDSATTLNTSSDLVIGAGAAGCTGITAPGGAGTYYAQVIYQAQSDLTARQNLIAGSKNAMIILSDGDATATASYTGAGGSVSFSSSSQLQPSSPNSLNGILGNHPNSVTYPSTNGTCGQAVVAANAAAAAGTLVYTIGYGAETSGCSQDSTLSASVTTGGGTWGPGDSPCQALGAMASSPANFYSDDGAGCKATNVNNAAITKLTAIFHQITASLTTARLIPNSTT